MVTLHLQAQVATHIGSVRRCASLENQDILYDHACKQSATDNVLSINEESLAALGIAKVENGEHDHSASGCQKRSKIVRGLTVRLRSGTEEQGRFHRYQTQQKAFGPILESDSHGLDAGLLVVVDILKGVHGIVGDVPQWLSIAQGH